MEALEVKPRTRQNERCLKTSTDVHRHRELSTRMRASLVDSAPIHREELTSTSLRAGRDELLGAPSEELSVGLDLKEGHSLLGIDPRLGVTAESAIRPAGEPESGGQSEVELRSPVGSSDEGVPCARVSSHRSMLR